MKNAVRSEKGFSLIELMIVVAIIGILATIAIPNFNRFQAKARQSEAKTQLSSIYTSMKAFQAEWVQYYADFRDIGYQPEGNIRFHVGFNATGALPTGYTGPSAISVLNCFATTVATAACYGAAGRPTYIGQTAPGAPTGTVTQGAAPTFIAEARGDIDADADIDVWRVNEQRVFTNTASDL